VLARVALMQSAEAADGRFVAFLGSSRLRAAGGATSAALLAAFAAALCVLAFASPAAAEVTTVGGVEVGVQPRSTNLYEAGLYETPSGAAGGRRIEGAEFKDEEGRPVVSSPKVYAIYWDPEDLYHGNWQELVNDFFANMSNASGSLASNVFAVDSQYTDAEGKHAGEHTTFAGAYTDTHEYPAAGCVDPEALLIGAVTCVSAEQLEAELQRFIASHSLPTGMSTIYYLLTPPGVTDCLAEGHCSDYTGAAKAGNASYEDSFCSYHAAINPSGAPEGNHETVLYAAIPWTAGGKGDFDLDPQSYAYECQDGGWEPGVEGAKAGTAAESYEPEPIEQEPNQEGRGPDGSYDGGLADLIVGQIANEQQNIVTDPLLDGWHGEGGEEVTDLCRDFFAPALGGSSGVETAEEKAARKLEESELTKKLLEGTTSPTPQEVEEAEAEAEALATKKPHHGEEGTEAGTLYDEELAGGEYYLNNAFNLAALELPYPGVPCLKGVGLEPSFTAPANVNAGEIVGFDGMESDITLDAGTAYVEGKATAVYPVFEWNFGDGTTVKGSAPGAPSRNSPEASPCEGHWPSPCAASAFHTYAYGGTYEVTLTVTDVGGNSASVTEPIVVAGVAAPAPAPAPEGGSNAVPAPAAPTAPQEVGSGSKGSGKGGSKPGKTEKTLSSPTLTALVVTKSTKALGNGLKVRYSVNEQAAGRFEVLVPAKLAKRLKLAGSKATGLPSGSKPETVIAHALLVTTRSARRTIAIEIPKRSAQSLTKLHTLTLTLRVSARDASTSDPQVSTLQTVATLHR
jgi:hypothetical protein